MVPACLALGVLGCSGGDSILRPPINGTLEIATATTGADPDADGYMVQIDAQPPVPIGANGSLRKTDVAPGSHTVQLSGLSPNCSVSGNPSTVAVTAGEVSPVAFAVTCGATTGSLQVTAATTGDSPDPDGYFISLDGVDRGALAVNGSVSLDALAPGSHTVGLSGIAGNCGLQEANPQAVTITAGAAATASFTVVCTTPPAGAGSIRITTVTTGPDADRDGYTVTLDGGAGQALAVNASVVVAYVAPGAHAVRLSGVAGNCVVQGDNPRTVTVAEGALADVGFAINCVGTTGSIQVTTETTGDQVDPDGYAIGLDGAPRGAIGASATATLAQVAVGSHSLSLSGVAPNCTVQGQLPRTVAVTPGASAPVSFQITCTATTGNLRIVTATTGDSPDADGYAYSIDDGAPQPIGVNGDVTVNGVGAGVHTVELSGLASNCVLTGDNPRPVNVPGGTTAEVGFAVTCAAPTSLRWTAMQSGSSQHLNGVWGASPGDVYAVGENDIRSGGDILHYDGQGWSTVSSTGALNAVWGSGPADIFAVGLKGDDGLIVHYNGTAWAEMTPPDVGSPGTDDLPGAMVVYHGVWGSSGSNVLAAGDVSEFNYNGFIARFDGVAWSSEQRDPPDAHLQDVFGTSATNVYVVGHTEEYPSRPHTLRHDGSTWTSMGLAGDHLVPMGVWASAPNDVFVVGARFDANAGGAPEGIIYHYDGSAWTPMPVPAVGQLMDIWGASPTDIYAVGPDAILHYDGTAWAKVSDTGGNDVWGSSPTDVFVVGPNGRILHGTP